MVKVYHGLITMAFLALGCFLLSLDTSWHIGVGVFFIIWGCTGILEKIFGEV